MKENNGDSSNAFAQIGRKYRTASQNVKKCQYSSKSYKMKWLRRMARIKTEFVASL